MADTAVLMGFDNANMPAHIIQVNAVGVPVNFEQQFWQNFRQIAADPVGRVLLYRLLIEIRRVDDSGINGCWEDGITTTDPTLKNRNKTRSIEVYYSNKSSFNFSKQRINIFLQNKTLQTFKIENGYLTTAGDIALFHEMLHWFHFLRHTTRYLSNRLYATSFKYNTRCYYGDVCGLCVWGEIRGEEIATILGSPDHNQAAYINLMPNGCFYQNDPGRGIAVNVQRNQVFIPQSDKFLNGDDLSENVYRISKTQINPTHRYMRFGHSDQPIQSVTMDPIPNRFRLAHKVAQNCYQNIIGNLPLHWFW